MLRLSLLATALLAGLAVDANAQQGASISQNPQGMVPGQRLQLGPMLGGRVVRQVMIGQDGGNIEIVYDSADAPQSQRVLRLENINGMLEVVYDTRPGGAMAAGSGGAPRLVQSGGGMYSVEYDKK